MLKTIFKVKLRIFIHTLEEIIAAPLLRTLIILVFMSAVVYICYYFAYYMFELLSDMEGAGSFLCDNLLNLFLMSLFFLLIFSNAISSYSTIFKNKELNILLTYPLNFGEIFVLKFLESVFLTSWAFMFLIGPFLYAYLRIKGGSLIYILSLFLYTLPYIFIAAVLGTFLTLFLIHIMPRRDIRGYLILFLAILALSSVVYLRHTYIKKGVENRGEIVFFISQLMPYFNFAQKPYLPSYWLSKAIILISENSFRSSLFYFWLLFINVAFFYLILYNTMLFSYYNSLDLLISRRTEGTRNKYWIWNFVKKILPFSDPSAKEIVIKDIKSIIRDPVQYFQLLIFFGILAVYFTNLQGEYYQSFPIKWKIFIAFLNLAATNLVLASLAVRFVYPLISLEGKRMWVLNLAPLSRWNLLLVKFIGISLFALFINTGLITISNLMLKIDKEFVKVSMLGSIISSFSIMGIILGVGSCFPNFKEENPSRIIAGFGGTLALIISLIYVGAMVFVLSFPFQLYMLGRISYLRLKFYNNISCLIFFIFSIIVIVLHLYKGKLGLEKAEF